MNGISRAPYSGESILTHFKRLQDDLRRNRLVSVVGGRLTQTEGGMALDVSRNGGSGGTDVLVKVSSNDTVSDYLDNKVVVVAPIVKTVLNDGTDEDLQLSLADDLAKPELRNSKRVYSFECYSNATFDGIIMEPGDIYLGPLAFILWDDIDGKDTTPSVSATDTHVWLEVRQDTEELTGSIGPGYAWLKYGAKSAMLAALDATEQLTKCVVPLVETVWADGVITKVKNLQCGDAKIFRAAG